MTLNELDSFVQEMKLKHGGETEVFIQESLDDLPFPTYRSAEIRDIQYADSVVWIVPKRKDLCGCPG